jgi:hypothetical protein
MTDSSTGSPNMPSPGRLARAAMAIFTRGESVNRTSFPSGTLGSENTTDGAGFSFTTTSVRVTLRHLPAITWNGTPCHRHESTKRSSAA